MNIQAISSNNVRVSNFQAKPSFQAKPGFNPSELSAETKNFIKRLEQDIASYRETIQSINLDLRTYSTSAQTKELLKTDRICFANRISYLQCMIRMLENGQETVKGAARQIRKMILK